MPDGLRDKEVCTPRRLGSRISRSERVGPLAQGEIARTARRNRLDSEVFLGDFDGHVALARVRGQVTMSQVRSNDSQFLKISIEALCRGDNSSSKALGFLLTEVTTCVGRATIKRVLVTSQMT